MTVTLFVVAAAIVACGWRPLYADEPGKAAGAVGAVGTNVDAIQYRKIFVPADKSDAWPRNGEKYLPIEGRDFDAWIRAANETRNIAESAACIRVAEYSARLDGTGRLRGSGRWTIELRSDRPAFLPLENLSLVLTNVHWADAPEQPARIGMWGRNANAPSRFGLEVRHSGVVTFDWRIEAHASGEQIEIPWRVPSANSVRLELDLPKGMQPHIDSGVVLSGPAVAETKSGLLRHWRIAMSPAAETSWNILNTDHKAPTSAAKRSVRERVKYAIGPRGLEMTTTWVIDEPAEQKREIAVSLPTGLRLMSVKSGDRELTWRAVQVTSPKSGTALIELPPSDGAKPTEVVLHAWQALAADTAWRLPQLRPENAFWVSGEIELEVSPSFELQSLSPNECVETSVSSVNATSEPEVHRFLAYTPSAGLEVRVARRQPVATVETAASLSLADPDLNGRVVSQWNLSRGAIHQMTGKLARGWVVQTVETLPADAMGEWFIDKRGDERQIQVQLSSAAKAARNVSVIITGRLQHFSLAEPIAAETMRMVTWADARTTKQLLSFQSNEPYAAEAVGNLPAITADSLKETKRGLFEPVAGSSLFDLTNAPKGAGVQLTFKRGPYAANLDIDLSRASDEVREVCRMAITPTASTLDRLIVYSTVRLDDAARWTESKSNSTLSAERLTANDPMRGKLPKDGDVWLVRLPSAMSQPFEIAVSTAIKRPERAPVPLFWLPEAVRQQGRVVARSRVQNGLWLEAARLDATPLPAELTSTDGENRDTAPVCAAFRYQPASCRDALRSPKLLATSASNREPNALARHIRLESFFWADGTATHQATYQLDSRGASELHVALAGNGRVVSAIADGHPLEITTRADANQLAIVHLPSNSESFTVSLSLETKGPAVAAGQELRSPLAMDETPFLSGEWIVWLPEEFSATGNSLEASPAGFNWRQRLFGPLGRPAGEQPFSPIQLVGDLAPNDETDATNATEVGKTTTTAMQRVAATGSVSDGVSPSGWRRFQESFVVGAPAAIVVLHPPAITAWAVACLIAAFLCGRMLLRKQRDTFVLMVAIGAGAALFLPAAYADLATGVFLGLLFSLVTAWMRPAKTAEERVPARGSRLALAGTLAVLVVIGVAKITHAAAPSANELATKTTSAQSPIYQVLIPADVNGKPTGTKYFVSEGFLRVLLSAESKSNSASDRWILRDAVYSGELPATSGGKETAGGNWTMTFSVETLARDTTVLLPLVRHEATWNATAMLDGIPLPIEWMKGGRACETKIAEPGRYSLVVSCVPKPAAGGDRNRISLTIPPVPGARVELRAPDGASNINISHAPAEAVASAGGKTFFALLDDRDNLQVDWAQSDGAEIGKPGFSLTELRWLDVKSAEVGLRVKYVLEGLRRPDSISVGYDDRWELITDKRTGVVEQDKSPAPGQHLLRIPISKQTAERQEAVLQFQLRVPPQLGNLRLPPVELASAAATKRWLAVSADESLDCGVVDSSANDGTVNEFFATWGDATNEFTPELVLSNFDTTRPLTLSVRPRETEPVVEESLNIGASGANLRVNYDARVTPSNFGDFKLEFAVPENLSVSDVVAADADPIPLRWTRPAKNRIHVFFDRSLASPYHIVLDGTVPLDPSGKTVLPRVSSAATESSTEKVRIYRDDDVNVALAGVPASAESNSEPIDEPPADWKSRPVTLCYLDAAAAGAARISVRPNAPRLSGDTLTILARENGTWNATFRCQLTVEDGNLDVLRLRVPATWSGPFQLESRTPATLKTETTNVQGGVLNVRYATSIAKGGSIDLRIRGDVKLTDDASIAVPAIVVENASHLRRFVAVAELADSQQTSWAESGVQTAAPPQKLLTGLPIAARMRALEITADGFQVVNRPLDRQESAPQIRLADTSVIESDSGAQLITTRLILAPYGLTECTLELPPGQTLFSVELDGTPALVRSLDKSRWQMSLGSAQLPQAIEVVTRLATKYPNRRLLELQRPTILAGGKAIPAEVSLWSFANGSRSMAREADGADEVPALDQAALRFDRLVSMAEASRATAAQLPGPDGFNWFQAWANLLTDVRSQTQSMIAPHLAQAESQVSHTSEEQITKAGERLDKWIDDCRKNLPGAEPSAEPKLDAATNTEALPAAPILAASGARDWSYYVAQGGSDHLTLHTQPLELTTLQVRIVGLLLIASALAATLWMLRKPALIDFICRWPHAIGILAALAYWAWLWPSWLGLLFAAICVWLSLRFAWPGRSLRTEASTVMRTARQA